jgi:hypothetical protein
MSMMPAWVWLGGGARGNSGSPRRRTPVAVNIALANAGATTGTLAITPRCPRQRLARAAWNGAGANP